MLGEDSVEAQPIKDALEKAREQTRVQPVGRKKFIQRSRARIEKMQSDLSREQSLLQGALENLEQLRDEAATSVEEPVHRHSAQMVVEDPGEEVQRLRAQVAELHQERATKQKAEESRTKKTLVLSARVLDLTPLPGAGPCSASVMMLTLIDAADSTLREARSA